jgi:hypothetical protein
MSRRIAEGSVALHQTREARLGGLSWWVERDNMCVSRSDWRWLCCFLQGCCCDCQVGCGSEAIGSPSAVATSKVVPRMGWGNRTASLKGGDPGGYQKRAGPQKRCRAPA